MSLPAYAEYKDSGVEWLGDVPKHWQVKQLKFILGGQLKNGVFKSSSDYGTGTKLVNVSDIFTKDNLINVDSLGLVNVSDKEKKQYKVKYGDLFFVRSSLKLEGIAQSACYLSDDVQDIVFECHLVKATPNINLVDPSFLYRYVNSNGVRFEHIRSSTTATMTTIDQSGINKVAMLQPPLSEQTNIARFLDHETTKIDALIAEQQRLIELLKEKRQAVISHAVTKGLDLNAPMKDSGVEWLGDVPEYWKISKLNLVIETRKGLAFPSSAFIDEGFPVVKSSDIKKLSINKPSTFVSEEVYLKSASAKLKAGSIILSTVGSSPDVKNSAVGQIAIVPDFLDGALLNQNTVIFEGYSKKINQTFLFFILCGSAYRDHLDLHAHGTANQASLSINDMLGFVFALPSINEQAAIVSFLEQQTTKIDELINHAHQGIDLLKERRSALISAAVTGKIDVRGWQPPATAATTPQGQQQTLFDD